MKPVTIDQRWLRHGAWALLAIAIVILAMKGSRYMVENRPEAATVARVVEPPGVYVDVAEKRTIEINLSSQGDTMPRHRTTLTAEVGGALTDVNAAFEPGETMEEGGRLLQIDRADYQAALTSAQAALADAKLAVEMELARKGQSLRDWEKLGRGGEPSDLVKRIPHLASANARKVSAESAVDKALRDLERTEILAPYACRIERTYVDVGAIVAPGRQLADVVSLGAVEVRLALSLEDYEYLQRDEAGRVTGDVVASRLIGGELVEWTGRLVRSDEFVDRDTRSIHVVAEFGSDGEDVPPIGMFVKASITGKAIPDLVEVKREALIDADNGDKQVIVLTDDDRLVFTPVNVKRTEENVALIAAGLSPGDRIVITQLSSPVNGLQVKVLDPEEGKERSLEGEDETPVAIDKPS